MRMAAIYARVSSEQQREENTIASQTAALIEFAQSHDLEVPRDWVFEAHDKIISVSDDDDIAPSHLLAPDFDPKVEHVMQVDVRQ